MANPDNAGAGAVDYLMYSGYVTLAYFWARMAVLAQQKIAAAAGRCVFLRGKSYDRAFLLRATAAAHGITENHHAGRLQKPDGYARGAVPAVGASCRDSCLAG